MKTLPTPMPTLGEIARRLAQPVHRIEYIIRSRHIYPASRAGNCRVFAETDVARIATELASIGGQKGGAA
jgi:hypothetical protein